MGILAIVGAVLGHFFSHYLVGLALGLKQQHFVFPWCCCPSPNGPQAKPWKRALALAAGPIGSYLLAVLPLAVLTMGTHEQPSLTIESVAPGLPAEQAGLRAGDVIIGIDGDRAMDFEQVRQAVANGKVHLDVHRPGEILQVDLGAQEGSNGQPVVGIVTTKEDVGVGFFQALAAAHAMPRQLIAMLLKPRYTTVGGPVAMFSPPSATAASVLDSFVYALAVAVALWSWVLLAAHLLPVPGFDGALLLLSLRELAGGKPPDQAFARLARKWILMLLLLAGAALVVLIFYQDIRHAVRRALR